MTNPYFQTELNTLKELAPEFARLNPALAPLLDGNRTDPDVERLLESLAYLIAMLRQKLACNLPKMIQMLVQLVIPQFLRPIPAITTLCFTSHATDGQSVTIPAGARFASVPVDGRKCVFTTSADVEVHPLELTDAAFVQHAGRTGEIRLSLSLKGLFLSRWQPSTPLRLRLTGDFASATELFLLLSLHLSRIVLAPIDGGVPVALPLDCLKPAGFSEGEELLPYPSNAFPGYQWLQEYFNSPGKLLSFDLDLQTHLPQLGDGMYFTISFILDSLPSGPPRISPESFTLNAVMAVNLYPHDADPISVNHRTGSYLIRPAGTESAHCQVYSVDQVTGYTRATAGERDYLPFDIFDDSGSGPIYQALPVQSNSGGYDVYLEVAYPGEMPSPYTETLSIAITCTDGNLPENLHIGDITEPLTALPDSITARNITPVTSGQPPPLDPGLLQKLISHLCMNHLSLEPVEHLSTLLKLYASLHGSKTAATANLKRIDGIAELEVKAGEQMVKGIPMRGREIRIKMRQDHFAGAGDMYLFGCMLDRFLGGYAATNTYTRLTLNETTRGVLYRWPIRLGDCTQPGLVFEPERADPVNKIGRRHFNTMVRQAGPDSTSLIDDLVAHGHEYSYKQVMHIAKRAFGPGGKEHISGVPWQKRVRVRPDLSLAFPASDVVRVERAGADLLVTTSFLGLYGTSSPMPTFYSEDLLLEAMDDSSITRDIIDIFHQRIYLRFFECVSKYRLFNRIGEEKHLADVERLYSVMGLGEKALRDSVQDNWPILRNVGLLSQFPRSALGLQTMLRDALGVIRLVVEQCVLRKVPIPVGQRMSLGLSGMSLGVNTVLGSEIHDRTGKIRIHIGPLTYKEYDSFLPGSPLYIKLIRLIRLYLIDPLEYDLKLILAAGEARPISLGDPSTARLGFNTWCGETQGDISALFPLSSRPVEPPPAEAEFSYPQALTEPKSLVDYYNQEMADLRDLTARFVEEHPEMAPMVSGHMPDQGVERVMEGDAYLEGLLQQKVDDDLPEVIHELTEALHPWNLQPKPAMTIVAFTPKAELKQPLLIPTGTEVASIPVQETKCRFRTCFDVTVHPLTLLDASFSQPSGKAPSITLQCTLNGIGLSGWKAKSLRFFLGDDYPAACDLYLLLTRYLKRITITSLGNGDTIELPPDCLKPVGFADDETILTQKKSFMPGHLVLQEYFLFPDKFLLIDLIGLEKCSTLGNGARFEISFELTKCPLVPKVSQKSFELSATPVINLFPHKAMPIYFVSDLQQRIIRPKKERRSHFQLYSVDQVRGLIKTKSETIPYYLKKPLIQHTKTGRTCQITRCKSASEDRFDTLLSIPIHKSEIKTDRIKLDIDLTCTNGTLAEKLNIGDICTTTTTTPEFVEPRNIKKITAASFQGTRHNRQWKLLSAFSLNSVSLKGVDNFRAILRLFIDSGSRNQIAVIANAKKIDAIESINAKPCDRLIGRSVYRGYEIRLKVRGSHFEGPGDLYLFCSVLERFLGGYVTQNCFVRLVVEEIGKGYRFEWPTRLGDRCVL